MVVLDHVLLGLTAQQNFTTQCGSFWAEGVSTVECIESLENVAPNPAEIGLNNGNLVLCLDGRKLAF